MNDLTKLKDALISKGFPELLYPKIHVAYMHDIDTYFDLTRINRCEYLIYADSELKEVKEQIILGGMALDFSQIAKDITQFDQQYHVERILRMFLPFYKTHAEIQNEEDAIKRGFLKELAAFADYTNTKSDKYSNIAHLINDVTYSELNKILAPIKKNAADF